MKLWRSRGKVLRVRIQKLLKKHREEGAGSDAAEKPEKKVPGMKVQKPVKKLWSS